MSNFVTVLKGMFKNKLRFGAETTKGKKIAILVVFAFAYAMIMFSLLTFITVIGSLFDIKQIFAIFFFFILLTSALIVLIFGIINLISTLYLSKDTDFYSMLPIKPSVVFAAKLAFVYIAETAIVAAVLLPALITLGIVAHAWAWYYVISILTLVVVPALPLFVACIIAMPIMYLASRLKNRAIISLIFYIVLFGGLFGVYIYFISSVTSIDVESITAEQVESIINAITAVLYIFYPYERLSAAAFGIESFGLGVGASTVVNLLIFVGISAVLTVALMFAAKFMYSQSVKANNQTYNAKARKGEFKATGSMKALIKREYLSSLRTTQVAFQCYFVMALPIIFSIILGIMFRNSIKLAEVVELDFFSDFALLLVFSSLAAIFASLGNAACTTFSREGSAFASLKILPVDIKRILWSKIVAWLVIALPVAAVCLTIVNALIFNSVFCILSFFSLLPLVAEFLVFGALWDLSAPKLKWTDPSQAIKHNTHVTLGQLIMMSSGFLPAALLFGLGNTTIDGNIVSIVCWSVIYAVTVIFGIVDIILYRKANAYYERIEV